MAVINQFKQDSNFQCLNSVRFIAKIGFWLACIVFGFLCLIPVPYLPSGLFDWWDKAEHVLAFLSLSSLGVLVYQKSISKVLIGLLVYGGLIEILQWFTSWRSGDFADWVANGIGILIGHFLAGKLIQKAHGF